MKLKYLLLVLIPFIALFALGAVWYQLGEIALRAEIVRKNEEMRLYKAAIDEIEDRILILSIYGEEAVEYYEDQDAKGAK